jgi:hypothetical protein
MAADSIRRGDNVCMIRRLLPILALILAAVPAFACAIVVTEPLKYAFKQAPIAFEGTLERIDKNGALHFTVHRQWKGAPVKTVVVPDDPSNCGWHHGRVGQWYVVVPKGDGSIDGGSHIRAGERGETLAKTLDARAGWWKCPLSSFTFYAILRRMV